MFFVQSAGNPNTGTGLHKSAMIQKISVAEAASVSHRREAVGLVKVHTVDSEPQVINPNGEQARLGLKELASWLGKRMGGRRADVELLVQVPPTSTAISSSPARAWGPTSPRPFTP